MESHPWLETAKKVAKDQGFFHWDLDFADVFARGGFDLQVGNPPWVRPRSESEVLLAEHDPWWQLAHRPTQQQKRKKRAETLALPGAEHEFLNGVIVNPIISEWLGADTQYPELSKQQPDFYRAFMAQTWRATHQAGAVGLIHPISHFTEKKAAPLRKRAYLRL